MARRRKHRCPNRGSLQYTIEIPSRKSRWKDFVPPHRRLPTYQQVANIPTQPMLPEQAYNHFNGEMSALFQGAIHTGYSSTYRIKEALLSMAVFGPGSSMCKE